MNYVAREHSSISGLYIVHDFISETEEIALLAHFDAEQWGAELKRRTQHYGYKYSYSYRKIDLSMKTDPIPQCAVDIAEKIEKVELSNYQLFGILFRPRLFYFFFIRLLLPTRLVLHRLVRSRQNSILSLRGAIDSRAE